MYVSERGIACVSSAYRRQLPTPEVFRSSTSQRVRMSPLGGSVSPMRRGIAARVHGACTNAALYRRTGTWGMYQYGATSPHRSTGAAPMRRYIAAPVHRIAAPVHRTCTNAALHRRIGTRSMHQCGAASPHWYAGCEPTRRGIAARVREVCTNATWRRRSASARARVEPHDLLVQPLANRRLALVRAARDVRREHEAWIARQRGGRGLGGKDVESEAGEVVGGERGKGGGLVEHFAAGGVDQKRAARQARDLGSGDHAARFGRQRDVQGENVARREQRIEGVDAGRAVELADVRVVRGNAHAERAGQARHAAADFAQAHDA